jgi:hypothetical protein
MNVRIVALLIVIPLGGCPRPAQDREAGDAPVAHVSSAVLPVDTNALLAAKLRDEHLRADLVDVTLDELVFALAKPGVKVKGLGPWSKRLKLSTREAPRWTTVQLLWDAHNRYGSFFFSASEDAIVVWPESRGEAIFLDDEGVTLRLLPDRHTIQATGAKGVVLWNANVIDTFRDDLDPDIDGPSPRVDSFSYAGKAKINVVFGRHSYATLDLRTGALTYFGSD